MLTMQIAIDALEKHRIKHTVSNGDVWLRGVRVGDSCPHDCLRVVKYGSKVVCSSGGDFIEVQSASVDEVLDSLLEASDNISRFEIASTELMNEDSVEPLIDLVAEVSGCPVMLVDGHTLMCTTSYHDFNRVIPQWGEGQRTGRLPWNFLDFLDRDLTYAQKLASHEDRPFSAVLDTTKIKTAACRIRTPENGGVAYLFMLGKTCDITEGKLQLMQIAAAKVKEWIESHLGDDRLFSKNDFLTRLASGEKVTQEEINENKILLDLRAASYVIAKVKFPRERSLAWSALAVQEQVPSCTCFEFGGELFALAAARKELPDLLEDLAQTNDMKFGLSWGFSDWNMIADAVSQTEVALSATTDRVAVLNSHCVLFYIFEMLLSTTRNIDIAHPAIEFLASYDEEHNSEYLLTLWFYLRHERNLVRTAEALNIHRNSLVYRIKRINELVEDMNLDDAETREHLMISFRLRGLKSWED